MKKNIPNLDKIRTIKKLLEKYSGRKVILKEFVDNEFYFGDNESNSNKGKEKPFQLYYINPEGDKTEVGSKDWLGGFDDINHLKKYAIKSYWNTEKEKAKQEGRNINKHPQLNDQGLPVGYEIKETGIGTTTISEAKKK